MSAAEDAVIAWLRERGFDPETHAADYDLLENRVIDSLHFMEFVHLLEQHTHRELLAEGLVLDQFRTFAAIRENFLAGSADEPDEVEEETI